jgi:hypothetical protein
MHIGSHYCSREEKAEAGEGGVPGAHRSKEAGAGFDVRAPLASSSALPGGHVEWLHQGFSGDWCVLAAPRCHILEKLHDALSDIILYTQMCGNISTSLGFLGSILPLTIKHVLRKFSTFAMGWEPCLHKGCYWAVLSGLSMHFIFYSRVNL